MKYLDRKLQIEQLDRKIKAFKKLDSFSPSSGWVYATRVSLGMSLEQLGKRMGMTAQSVKELEQRERKGAASLKSLDEAAKAFGLKFTYGFSSLDKSLNEIIKYRINQTAEKIVLRTHKTMALEDQANSRSRLRKAIKDRAEDISKKRAKHLWD